jgi:hypothetical protein
MAEASNIGDMVSKYGFPIIAAAGMGGFIYYVWTWVTTEIKPVIGQANGTLIALIDRIRMLDNDLIRLNQKVETVLELRGKSIERERIEAEHKINKDEEQLDAAGHRDAELNKPIGMRKATKEEIIAAAGDE